MNAETLEELKAIVDDAPYGATECLIVRGEIYYLKLDGLHLNEWLKSHNSWTRNVKFEDVESIRSLSDIKAIVKLMEDKNRLDHLQKCNEIFNKRIGSNYGWRVDWNHNRIAIVDTGLKGVTIRNAIDEHMRKAGDL